MENSVLSIRRLQRMKCIAIKAKKDIPVAAEKLKWNLACHIVRMRDES